jgi:hypothetical protein
MKHIVENDGLVTPSNVAAAYWNSPLSRKEAQQVFDEYGGAIQNIAHSVFTLDLTMSFLMERLGIKPEEVSEWAQKKAEELKAKQEIENAAKSIEPTAKFDEGPITESPVFTKVG